jgi:glycosyltransferase involved in cell wall biosynthesis
MAVHNGAAFLRPQLESILGQLRPSDELIVVDDASRDDSLLVLRRIAERRLRVFRNEHNVGVFGTFERALGLAQGDIVFLSDQDDVWLPGKVDKVLQVFATRPEVTLVASDAMLIDQQGRIIANSFFANRGRFSTGVLHNLIKNKYLGCTLAFRRTMLDKFLPIPRDVPMHDMWFGVLNDIHGKTFYIDEPLIAYRRHGGNVSPSVGVDFGRRILWRWRLVKNIALRLLGR